MTRRVGVLYKPCTGFLYKFNSLVSSDAIYEPWYHTVDTHASAKGSMFL
jgi:hypothetical protein